MMFLNISFVVVGFLLVVLLVPLVVLPNRIQGVHYNVNLISISTNYSSYKTYCECTQVYVPLSSCGDMISKNVTGKCDDGGRCIQKRYKGDNCKIDGTIVCELSYCYKTVATVKVQYDDISFTGVYDCIGDLYLCDPYSSDVTKSCVSRLSKEYMSGIKLCSYRSTDRKLSLSTFGDNGAFIAGVLFTVVGGSFLITGLLIFFIDFYRRKKERRINSSV
jgi:hypothetical protein